MVEEQIFGCIPFFNDENTLKFKCIGNVILKLNTVQQICTKEFFLTIAFFILLSGKQIWGY